MEEEIEKALNNLWNSLDDDFFSLTYSQEQMQEDIRLILNRYNYLDSKAENLINKNKELENNLDKVEGKCGELFAVLFTVIRNNTVLPKGEELGKSQIEITQMTVKTIDALIEKIDYEKVRDLLKEAGEM